MEINAPPEIDWTAGYEALLAGIEQAKENYLNTFLAVKVLRASKAKTVRYKIVQVLDQEDE